MKFASFPIWVLLLSITSVLSAQTALNSSGDPKSKGQFSGNLLLNYQKYLRDDSIGANTKVYKENRASADAWLFMQYRIQGYSFIVRYDAFNNSPLLDPQDAYTDHGIGFWQAQKQIDKLDITVGSFYDQFGSGILFRSYEQRMIGIDYAMQGIRLKYQLGDNWTLKGFAGNQKGNIRNRFGASKQVMSGLNLEGLLYTGKKGSTLSVGASAVNRTLDRETMDALVANINGYELKNRFYPKYNVYGFNGYFAYNKGNFAWTGEANFKTPEAILGYTGKYENKSGKVYYTSLSWGKGGINWINPSKAPQVKDSTGGSRPMSAKEFKAWQKSKQASIGFNIQARHVEQFAFRTTPTETLLNGLISYLPSLTRQNTYRLLARYNAPGQELGEDGIQGEIEIKPFKGLQITLNGSYVQSLAYNGKRNSLGEMEAEKLYHEGYFEVLHTTSGHDKIKWGLQQVFYNQARYEQEPEYEVVKTVTPFFEWLHRTKGGRNVRIEAQYLHTDKDQGSFANLMVEYYIKKNLSVAVGDMVNVDPHRYPLMRGNIADKVLHYPTFFIGYIEKNTVFTLSYLKQQQGVNCSGGICRVEPAFSGVRFTVSSNF